MCCFNVYMQYIPLVVSHVMVEDSLFNMVDHTETPATAAIASATLVSSTAPEEETYVWETVHSRHNYALYLMVQKFNMDSQAVLIAISKYI